MHKLIHILLVSVLYLINPVLYSHNHYVVTLTNISSISTMFEFINVNIISDSAILIIIGSIDNENENIDRSTCDEQQYTPAHSKLLLLIPTIATLHVLPNKPLILLYRIALCTGFTIFGDIMICKYYCKTSSSNIATLTSINNIISIIANLFWTLFSRKSSMKKNSALIIGFILPVISNTSASVLPFT